MTFMVVVKKSSLPELVSYHEFHNPKCVKLVNFSKTRVVFGWSLETAGTLWRVEPGRGWCFCFPSVFYQKVFVDPKEGTPPASCRSWQAADLRSQSMGRQAQVRAFFEIV